MRRKKKQDSVYKTVKESEAMINYAMAKGQKLPPNILAAFKRFKLYEDFKDSLANRDKDYKSRSTPTTNLEAHPFIGYSQPQIINTASGSPRLVTETEVHIPSEEEMVNELMMVHQDLTTTIYPATPSAVVMLEEQKRRPFRFLGPVPLIQRMTFVSILSLLIFLGLFMFDEVTASSVNGNILDYEDPTTFLLNELFILAIAAAGASFYALFEAYKYISNASFDAKYESMYWIRFILGVLSGVILAQFIFIDPTAYGATASETTNSQGLGGFITYKPVLAFLGGFSARVVHKILNSLVDSLETFISGSARDMLRAREESAKVQMEERIANIQRENSVNDATNRFNEAIRLIELQKQLGKTGAIEIVNQEIESMIQGHLSAINGGNTVTNTNEVNNEYKTEPIPTPPPVTSPTDFKDLTSDLTLTSEDGKREENPIIHKGGLPPLPDVPEYPEDNLPPIDDGLNIDIDLDDIPTDPPGF